MNLLKNFHFNFTSIIICSLLYSLTAPMVLATHELPIDEGVSNIVAVNNTELAFAVANGLALTGVIVLLNAPPVVQPLEQNLVKKLSLSMPVARMITNMVAGAGYYAVEQASSLVKNQLDITTYDSDNWFNRFNEAVGLHGSLALIFCYQAVPAGYSYLGCVATKLATGVTASLFTGTILKPAVMSYLPSNESVRQDLSPIISLTTSAAIRTGLRCLFKMNNGKDFALELYNDGMAGAAMTGIQNLPWQQWYNNTRDLLLPVAAITTDLPQTQDLMQSDAAARPDKP